MKVERNKVKGVKICQQKEFTPTSPLTQWIQYENLFCEFLMFLKIFHEPLGERTLKYSMY